MFALKRGLLLIPCLVFISLLRANSVAETGIAYKHGRHVLQGEDDDDDFGGAFRSEDDRTYCTLCPEENGCEVCCCYNGECVDRDEAEEEMADCSRDILLSVEGTPATALECARCAEDLCDYYFHWCM